MLEFALELQHRFENSAGQPTTASSGGRSSRRPRSADTWQGFLDQFHLSLCYLTTERESVPYVKPFATPWPLARNGKHKAFKHSEDSLRLLVPTKNYVLMKRLGHKEEKRRLTASCLLKADFPFPYVGIENHVNYVYHAERDLTEDEVFGIAAIFNSSLIDRYFRTISGNTQVNATEIRSMNFPDLKTLARIGRLARRKTTEAETIVLKELGITTFLVGTCNE